MSTRQQFEKLLADFRVKYPEVFQVKSQFDLNRQAAAKRYREARVPVGKRTCRLAGLIGGAEKWHAWRPISAYEELKAQAADLSASGGGIIAWVETR